jgi:hypothetical protein
MNEILQIALSWLVKGFATIPIRWRDKRPDSKLLPEFSWEFYKDHLPTTQELIRWFPGKLHNLGLVMGWNNLVVIDFDNMAAYETWRQVEQIQTYEVKTARGMHVYFKIQEPVNNSHSELLDIKAHGYVLIPPSIHPSGYEYAEFNQNPIVKIDQLVDVLPAAFIPEPPALTEFKPVPVSNSVCGLDLWATVENPMDPNEDLLKQIRERVSLLDLIPDAVPTGGHGRWYTALCPFHDDHHPSFWIDTLRGICGCRRCQMVAMDVVNLYARLHGLSNRDAIFQLAKVG